MARQAVDPPGDSRQDLWVICELAKHMGLDWNYLSAAEVFEEIRMTAPSMAGITWQRLEAVDSLTYPLLNEGDEGKAVIFENGVFPTKDGKGHFVPVDYLQADELPDEDYPVVFITARQLEHWHTGTMSRHSRVLDAIEPGPVILINPEELQKLNIAADKLITVESRRGKITAVARADRRVQKGVVMMSFAFREAAANLITNDALDPFGKIPGFKYCAVRVTLPTSA